MAKRSDGVVKSANMTPLKIPVHGLCERAQAEKTIKVCPQGKNTVKKPNRKVAVGRSFNSKRDNLLAANLKTEKCDVH